MNEQHFDNSQPSRFVMLSAHSIKAGRTQTNNAQLYLAERYFEWLSHKNFCLRVVAEHYSSLCQMVQPYLKYQISLILSPYLAQHYLAKPRVLSVCACLCLMAQPFLDNIQLYAPITSHDFLF